jgi:hypothetical protein
MNSRTSWLTRFAFCATAWAAALPVSAAGRPVLEAGSVTVLSAGRSGDLAFEVAWRDILEMTSLSVGLEQALVFGIAESDCPDKVQGEGSCRLALAFDGGAAGTYFDLLVAELDRIALSSFMVEAPQREGPGVRRPPARLAIDEEASVLSARRTTESDIGASLSIVLRNVGKNVAPAPKVWISPSDASYGTWTLSGETCGWRSIAPGEACRVDLEATPHMVGRYEADVYVASNQIGAWRNSWTGVGMTDHERDAARSETRWPASVARGSEPEPVATLVVDADGERLPGAPKALRPGDVCPAIGTRPEIVVDYDTYGDWDDENFKTYQCTLVENDAGNRWCMSEKGDPYIDRVVATYRLRPNGWAIEMGGGTHFIPEVQCGGGVITRTTRGR